MKADEIIARLDKCRPNGTGKWQACCPAHDDKSPSLSIRDVGDRVLLYCFGGCSVNDICAALSIRVYDLFFDGRAPREILAGVTRRDVLDTLVTEYLIIDLAESDRSSGKPISEADLRREQLAHQFIRVSAEVTHG